MLSVVPLLAAACWIALAYFVLRLRLRAFDAAASDPASGNAAVERSTRDELRSELRASVAEARHALAGTTTGSALAAVDDAALDHVVAVVARAVRTGDGASLLLRRATSSLYILALPVREPSPESAARYLGASWPEHIAEIRDGAGTAVAAVIVLRRPGAPEATLLVGYAPAPGVELPMCDPDALLDARTARVRGANQFRHVMQLTPSPADGV